MAGWDQYFDKLDSAVDAHVGDTIDYSISGKFVKVQGFVVTAAEPQRGEGDYLDNILGVKKRVKLNKSLGILPSGSHRLRHPQLGAGTWRPLGVEDDEETQGRYWIFDVQKVGA